MESKPPQLDRAAASMEAFQQLSIESFSYSWLINIRKPSFDALDDTPDGFSFIEMDPKLSSLQRITGDGQDFDFGLSGSQTPALVPADQIFSNGLLLPLHMIRRPPGMGSSTSSDPLLSRSLSLDSSRVLLSLSSRHQSPELCTVPSNPVSVKSPSKRVLSRKGGPKLPLLGSCGRSSKKLLQKYLCFLMPLYKKVRSLGMIRPPDSDTRVPAGRRRANSLEIPHRASDASLRSDWGPTNSFDLGVEKSIDEAVLHCKKSSGRNE